MVEQTCRIYTVLADLKLMTWFIVSHNITKHTAEKPQSELSHFYKTVHVFPLWHLTSCQIWQAKV